MNRWTSPRRWTRTTSRATTTPTTPATPSARTCRDYPPDRYQGVNTVGVTAVEEDSGESFAERTWREEPEDYRPPQHSDVGQLVDPDDVGE